MKNAQIALRKDIYRRFRNLSDNEATQVLEFIDNLRGNEPNEETIAAMEEAARIATDPNTKRYVDFSELLAEIRTEI